MANTKNNKAEVRASTSNSASSKPKAKSVAKISKLTPNTYVTVKNGFNGKLVYRSRRTNERYVWDEFGAEQEIELSELKSAKNSYKNFFIHNWFLFDDPEVIDYLGVGAYYKNALKADGFDELFNKDANEISEIISKLSKGQKKSLVYRVKQLIEDDKLDSINLIKTLEKCLNVSLSKF